MQRSIGLVVIAGLTGLIASANAQPAPSPFDGTYKVVSYTNVNATYTDRNGRMASCPNRRPAPLHIENGRVRYTTATGYKIRGTVDPQGQLTMGLIAPSPNAGSAGSQPLNLRVNGQIDGTGTARVRQTGSSCSYDWVWQKASQ
jgi:hypothetical protein